MLVVVVVTVVGAVVVVVGLLTASVLISYHTSRGNFIGKYTIVFWDPSLYFEVNQFVGDKIVELIYMLFELHDLVKKFFPVILNTLYDLQATFLHSLHKLHKMNSRSKLCLSVCLSVLLFSLRSVLLDSGKIWYWRSVLKFVVRISDNIPLPVIYSLYSTKSSRRTHEFLKTSSSYINLVLGVVYRYI